MMILSLHTFGLLEIPHLVNEAYIYNYLQCEVCAVRAVSSVLTKLHASKFCIKSGKIVLTLKLMVTTGYVLI